MRKILNVVCTGLILTAVLWASGEDEGGGTEKLKLSGWSYEVDTVNDNLKTFTEQTGIPADPFFNFPSDNYYEKQTTSFVGGTNYDVVYVRDSYLPEWAGAEWIIPLDGFDGIEDIKNDMSQSVIDQMSFNGKLYGLPYYAGRAVMTYNSDHLEQAGIDAPPATWDELLEQSRIIKEMGISEYPIILFLNKSQGVMDNLEILTAGHGGTLFDKNNNPIFDGSDPAAKEALAFMKDNLGDLIDPSSMVSDVLDVVRAMAAGTRTFTFLTDYNLKVLNDPESSTIAGKAEMALIPGNDAVKSGSIGWIRFYSITANSRNPEAAYELLKFLGHRDKNGEFFVSKRWALDFGLGFVQIPLFQDEEINKDISAWGDPAVMQMQDEYVVGRPYRFTPWFQEWQTSSWGEIQKAVKGDEPIDAVLAEMAENARSIKAEY